MADLTDKKQRDLASGDISVTYIIEAGAGTGKTTILVKRFLKLIMTGSAKIDEIVSITFTEKAAAEMLTRVRDNLEEICHGKSGLAIKAHCRDALDNFSLNRISTIHGFAGNLLREKPFEAEVDPFFEINDPRGHDIFNRVWEEWIEKELGLTDSPIRYVVEMGVKHATITAYVKFVYQNRDFFTDYIPLEIEYNIDEFIGLLKRTGRILKDIMDNHCSNYDDKGKKEIEKFLALIKAIDRGTPREIERLLLNIGGFKAKGSKSNYIPGDKCTEQKKVFKDLNVELNIIKNIISQKIIGGCLNRIKEFIKLVESEKFRHGVLDFRDLLVKARFLLRDNINTRRYYQRKFRYILVDEFQDTDPLQAEIVFFLSGGIGQKIEGQVREAEPVSNWEECGIKPGKLFIVGDPKQSIYRFRRADIEIYEKVKEILKRGGGESLNISVNFRSLRPVVEFVNKHFSKVIKKPSEGNYQPEYVSLSPFREENENIPSLVLLNPDDKLQETMIYSYDVRLAEAGMVAEYIDYLVNESGIKIGGRSGNNRPIRYKDIAMLFPRTSDIDIYESALSARGIPYVLEAGNLFFKRQEISDLIIILKAIDNPLDEVAVLSVLKSPLAGVSDEEILQASINGVSFNYLEVTSDSSPDIRKIFNELRFFHKHRGEVSISILIEMILDWSRYREFHIVTSADRRPEANIEKFMGIAREYEEAHRGTLRGFIGEMSEKLKEKEAEPDAPLAESDDDAVLLITAHKSKGLEFPVVIPVNLMTQKPSPKTGQYFIDRETHTFEARMNPLETPGFEDLRIIEDMRLTAEEIRLLYVACTRAIDMLVIPRALLKKKEELQCQNMQSHMSGLFLFENPELQDMFHVVEYGADIIVVEQLFRPAPHLGSGGSPDPPGNSIFTSDLERWKDERQKLIEQASRTEYISSYSTEKTRKEDVEETDETAEFEDTTGMRIGRAYHRVMERIDFESPVDLKNLSIAESTRENVSGLAHVVEKLAGNTLKSDLIKTAIKSGNYRKEFPFTVELDGTVTRGFIDLVIKTNDGFIVIDYKSDDVTPNKIPDHVKNEYSMQIDIYGEAMKKITGGSVDSIYYYFATPGIAYKVK
ncbi:MAG: UvrD-helicase domain-containing protein [Candidatus Eremiobacteraeota bacterium]|nr:UvrD-helicase domain-containing protein [Candidatus Eremiobacteraeota bacterium]